MLLLLLLVGRRTAGFLLPSLQQRYRHIGVRSSEIDGEESAASSCVILLRHGESIWNPPAVETFTGWTDVELSARGEKEAIQAGETLKARGVEVDLAFTSLLQRATRTLDLTMESCGRKHAEIHKSWRLNERHYGGLQGLNKAVAAEKMGEQIVREWRRSWSLPPPPMQASHPLYKEIYENPLYQNLDLPVDQLPRGESLAQCAARLEPYWFSDIVPAVRAGKTTLIVAHANSLRALLRIIFRRQVSEEQIRAVKIPTGVPLVYRLNEVPIDDTCDIDYENTGLCEGLSETPPYDLVPQPPPQSCQHLQGEMLWPLEECPLIYDDWSAELTRLKNSPRLSKHLLPANLIQQDPNHLPHHTPSSRGSNENSSSPLFF